MKKLCLCLLSLSFSSLATTAVEGISVNHLTSLHSTGPVGWPTAGKPFAPPIYNAERDQLIGLSYFGYKDETAPSMWGLAPVQGHYFALAKEVAGFVGFAEHPTEDKLYSIDLKGNVFSVHSDGSNKVILFDNTEQELNNRPNVQPIFDNQERLLFIDTDHKTYSRLMRLEKDNTLTELYRFNNNPHGDFTAAGGMLLSGNTLYGYLGYPRGIPHLNTLSIDDDFVVGALYAVELGENPIAALPLIHEFTLNQGEVPWHTRSGDEGRIATYLVEDEAGYLYGSTTVGSCRSKGIISYSGKAIGFASGLCGGDSQVHNVIEKNERLIHTEYPHYEGSNPHGSLFRIKKDGSEFNLLHTFNGENGSQPRGPMVITDTGFLYGTTMSGGIHKSENTQVLEGNEYPNHPGNMTLDGTIYRLNLADIQIENGQIIESGFEHVHSFKAGIAEDSDGKVPTGLMLAENGKLYGTTLYGGRGYSDQYGGTFLADNRGTVFEVDLSGLKPTGSVSISITPGNAQLGEEVEVTWSSHNAADCVAIGGVAVGDWVPDGQIESQGSIKISPESGIYTFTINCRDADVGSRLGALSTLYVNAEAKIKQEETLSYGNGGALGFAALTFLSALGVRRLRRRRSQS
ncbi:hypothetical protein [Pseudoalteromonas luteoviolacea]|uniref:Uncharacterized protein n=1 Tax=Pseudoalteromonas luteoviolacea H33 TaxID=1365251 RepID=A0A167CIH0_9GAMM|nr:hypothetical protein [Pseudoalteromonas luteoviolacea]KZN47700.1 hypothetical protein N476_23135 [Pseudoalteromonas luteoviolacea H33]KZN75735.1 hypothetical protein N477_17460 [Pseudoalteromonas luteoviolacea H33-S]MBQ4879155.1 hypothetical protein [Pseudoalteromonas luteoviolacea]MBQ4908214.1 hypothetical protein [Pseudoalteromonas luteoviolacea]